jgi:hypothetical protein
MEGCSATKMSQTSIGSTVKKCQKYAVDKIGGKKVMKRYWREWKAVNINLVSRNFA